ncbi:phosphoribosylaminoimidazolesuccinocarboxamide synthase [candidate division WOR-3 bacterium]|nr:phosphoribosylaminoimidazolesuccinocarboxamide synthase [candidate division WOR-3 bacterium]
MERLTDVPIYKIGKVREVYDLGERLLIVASDRISAFDVVLASRIPEKGKILTQMSLFWMDKTKKIIENHLISGDVKDLPPQLEKYKSFLWGRIMITEKTESLPIEAVARGYLAGSGWREYRERGEICGIKLPKGLVEAGELAEPIFTPSTKATEGHDINITEKEAEEIVGKKNYDIIKEASLNIYKWAKEYALKRGIIIADTKFEFGKLNDRIILIDELLTPDSSRFWPRAEYEPGHGQLSFDKQYVRDYLETTGWDKKPPAPSLPEDVIKNTQKKYQEAFNLLTKE